MSHTTHADLGGQRGHGAVTPEPEGERFHADWEPRVLALTLAMGATGQWNIDQSRAARESLPGYATLGYYGIWFEALLRLLAERGLAQPDEAASGRALHARVPLPRVLAAADVAAVLARGAATSRPAPAPARFTVGQAVRTRQGPLPHHTRLPRYVQGHAGTVTQVHGAHVFADTNAQGLGEQPQWLYTVQFEARALWGDDTTARLVSVDAWESYLEPAAAGHDTLQESR